MSNYVEIYRVVIYHDFFEGNRCRGVNFVPIKECKDQMWNLGLLFKQVTGNEWGVYAKNDELQKQKLRLWLEAEPNALVFQVEVSQRDFFLYTDWPGYSPKECYVFEAGVQGQEFLDLEGELHYGVVPEDRVIQYKLDQAWQKRNRQIVGLLKLGFSSKMLENFWDKDLSRAFGVTIRFHSLKFLLEFVLIPRNFSANQNLKLKEATGKMEFSSLEQFELMHGQLAYRGWSSSLVPLRESYEYRIQLWELKQTGRRLITAEVPFPEAGEFSIKASKENSKIVSKYIYF